MSAAKEHPTAPVTPPEGTRAARARMPIATHVVEHVAIEHGVCIRPVPLRRVDPDTGASQIIDVDCGATTDDKCPPCAARRRRQRMAQSKEGWHAETEPVVEPDTPTDEQQQLALARAELEKARVNALANGEDTGPIESAIDQVEAELADSGVRGSVTRKKPTKVRSTKRRQDVPDLPATKVTPVTVGRAYSGNNDNAYRPSVMLNPNAALLRSRKRRWCSAEHGHLRLHVPGTRLGALRHAGGPLLPEPAPGRPGSTCSTSPPCSRNAGWPRTWCHHHRHPARRHQLGPTRA
jgi:hypothetical protein